MILAQPTCQPDYVSVRLFSAFAALLSVTEPVQACPRVADTRNAPHLSPPDTERGMYFRATLITFI